MVSAIVIVPAIFEGERAIILPRRARSENSADLSTDVAVDSKFASRHNLFDVPVRCQMGTCQVTDHADHIHLALNESRCGKSDAPLVELCYILNYEGNY